MVKIEMKHLREVARFHDDSRITVRGTQRLLQKGPYRFYAEPGAMPYDDYVLDGRYVLLGSVLNVVSPSGTFQVTRADGKIAVSELYHVIEGLTDDDTEYLAWVLAHTPVAGYVDLGGQVVRLEDRRMAGISVPWPDADARKKISAFMADCRDRVEDARKEAASLKERGARAFLEYAEGCSSVCLGSLFDVAEGCFLDAKDRRLQGRYPVVSSQGVVGHSDEVFCDGQCIVVGQAGQYALQYWMPDGAFALQDTICISKPKRCDAPEIPLEAAYFALHAGGVRSRLRVAGKSVKAKAIDVSRLGEYSIPDFSDFNKSSHYLEVSKRYMQRIVELEKEADVVARKARQIMDGIVKGDGSVLSEVMHVQGRPFETADTADVIGSGMHALEKEFSTEKSVRLVVEELFKIADCDFEARGAERTPFDVAWEVIPLLFARLKEGRDAFRCAMGATGRGGYGRAIDGLLVGYASGHSELLFLESLTTSFSSLSKEGLEKLVGMLLHLPDCMDCASTGSYALRMLNDKGIVRRIGDSEVYEQNGAACSLAVADLMSGLASVFAPKAEEIFDPCMIDGSMAAAMKAASGGSVIAQTTEASSMLIEHLCSSLMNSSKVPEIAVGGSSLLEDAFPGRSFGLVVSFLPCNETDWADGPLSQEDPRWIFGLPPRNKANLAWFQHAYAHRSKEGTLILLAANAMLHESRGCEPSVRKSIIDSGCIRAVISLPGRLFGDGRAAQSIVIAQDFREGECETLFIDATGCGADAESIDKKNISSRLLPAWCVDKVLSAVRSWRSGRGYADEKGFCRSVGKTDILAEGILTPWTFV